MTHIYLDANSTTRMLPEIRQAMIDCYSADYVNPASQHQPGQAARRAIEKTRATIVSRVGASPADRLIFTSGGTEANNLAIIGLAEGMLGQVDLANKNPPEIVVSAIEHPAVLAAAEFLATRGFVIKHIPVSGDGVAQVEKLSELIGPMTRLVSLMFVNNETGVIQRVAAAAAICREKGVPLHCDAVQAIGKIPLNFGELGVSAMTLTAHKSHGPRGIGGLILAEGMEVQPTLFGGFQQLGQRPGTEDVALAVGFAKSVELSIDQLNERSEHLRKLRDDFEQLVCSELSDVMINGGKATRAPHTSNLSFPGINRQALMMAVDVDRVAISTGSACASGSSEPSHVLTAMQCGEDVVSSSIRVSFSSLTTGWESIEGGRRIVNAIKRLRQSENSRNS